MSSFRLIDHTADAGIVAEGDDLPNVFVQAALALFSITVDLAGVAEVECREISVQAADREALLVAWLNELIYLVDAERLLFRRFEILECTDTALRAIACGEGIDPKRHHLKTAVKAATYHMLSIVDGPPLRAHVIVDL